jgi:hypothetical protein
LIQENTPVVGVYSILQELKMSIAGLVIFFGNDCSISRESGFDLTFGFALTCAFICIVAFLQAFVTGYVYPVLQSFLFGLSSSSTIGIGSVFLVVITIGVGE